MPKGRVIVRRAEVKTDSLLRKLADSPVTLILLVAVTVVAAFLVAVL